MRTFSVRKDMYKLRVIQEQKTEDTVIEKIELVNWVDSEKLNLRSNRQVVEHLKNLLNTHIHDEGVFARRLGKNAEKQRIKDALGKARSKWGG